MCCTRREYTVVGASKKLVFAVTPNVLMNVNGVPSTSGYGRFRHPKRLARSLAMCLMWSPMLCLLKTPSMVMLVPKHTTWSAY